MIKGIFRIVLFLAIVFAFLIFIRCISTGDFFKSSSVKINKFETPINYENKTETSFEVRYVVGNCAIASEAGPSAYDGTVHYLGKSVLLVYDKPYFYRDQIIHISHPVQIGTYTDNKHYSGTIPAIEFKE